MPGSIVSLPRDVKPPFQVYVNGVPQIEGRDYVRDGRRLRFERELVKEGRLGFWRWFLGAWGVGTYGRNDSVDVSYHAADGSPRVAEALEIERAGPGSRAGSGR
jgi:hypothetical protein